ncbi:two component, sigma54 specific, transcriptional regulator, Fis family [Candidatus Moduliflexus flocculans]|uniref:Two component, sigma54 specific, transcriptional regulator, Fis family n=1 Tax=Candidatus Moduliflexus flocculans TaxID=1499966 RepID=A0A0S6VVJ4_9BACT|nr:two component, sigma54 specific, transcriptional regulator, Fis family [Candidatus Moduliflexus flocculans]
MKPTILVIDDKPKLCQSLAQNFDQRGFQTLCAATSSDALQTFSTHSVNIVLLDIMLGRDNGLELLKKLHQMNPAVPVIMITGHGSIDTAVQSMKLGAVDYVTKPVVFDKLLGAVEHALNEQRFRAPAFAFDALHPDATPIITRNKQMAALYEKAQKLAATDLPILICGENGTGKEVVADFIHQHSPRAARKMVKINCAAFPETLLDNELFGHEKGSYTGAETAFKGVFERAHESSLFLDEIGDMPLTIQAKILRTLQHNEIRRIGSERTITVDARFIAATNKPLDELIQAKQFREDLYYRLNTAVLHLPPLRERKEDIPLLADYFLKQAAAVNAKPLTAMSQRVLDTFLDYHWPGNVRELKNALNYAAVISSQDVIDLEDLPPHLAPAQHAEHSDNVREEMERGLILKTLVQVNYNKKKAAEVLKMSRKTLYNKLEKYGFSSNS